jgi:WD40 repeat protein
VKSGRLLHRFGGPKHTVWGVAFSPDGKRLLGGSADGSIRLWEVASRREVAKVEGLPRVNDVAFSPDGQYALSGGEHGDVRLWRLPVPKDR